MHRGKPGQFRGFNRGGCFGGGGKDHRQIDGNLFTPKGQTHGEVHGGEVIFIDDDTLFLDLLHREGPGGDLGDEEFLNHINDHRLPCRFAWEDDMTGAVFQADVIQEMVARGSKHRDFQRLIGKCREGEDFLTETRSGQLGFHHGSLRQAWKSRHAEYSHHSVDGGGKIFYRSHGGLEAFDVRTGVDIHLDTQHPDGG